MKIVGGRFRDSIFSCGNIRPRVEEYLRANPVVKGAFVRCLGTRYHEVYEGDPESLQGFAVAAFTTEGEALQMAMDINAIIAGTYVPPVSPKKFVAMIAKMQLESEFPDGVMPSEDAIATVNSLIEDARDIMKRAPYHL